MFYLTTHSTRTRKCNIQVYYLFAVYYLFVSVALSCFVLYLTKIILLKICILHCLVLLNSILLNLVYFENKTNKTFLYLYEHA